MVSRSILIFSLLLFGGSGLAQSESGPERPGSIAARFARLIETTQAHEANDSAASVQAGRSALALGLESENPVWELQARAVLGNALRLASDYPAAREVMVPGLRLALTENTALHHWWLRYNLGRLAWNQGLYGRAEERFLRAQKQAEEMGERQLLAQVLNSRGIVAANQDEIDRAEALYRRSLTLASEVGDTALQPKVLNNLALLLRDRGEVGEARKLLEANLELHTAAQNRRGMANALINLSSIAALAGDHESALSLAARARSIRRELSIPRHIAAAHIQMGLMLVQLDRGQEALDELTAGEPFAAQVSSHELWANLYDALSRAHASVENFREALRYQRKAEQERQLVYGENTRTRIAAMRENNQADLRQREIAQLQATREKQAAEITLQAVEIEQVRRERWGLLLLLVVGLIAVTATILFLRARVRTEREIRERTQRAREEAERANALKSQLLNLVSHDLKNPLAAVQMTAEMLAMETQSNPGLHRRSQIIHDTSQRMLQLVGDLLDSSAAEEHRLKLHRRRFDLTAVVREQLPLFQERLDRKHQRLHFDAPSDSPANISADLARVRQVIENLIDNAIKYSRQGGTITVSIAPAPRVQLRVRDEGPGISESDQSRLFERFAHLSTQPTGGEESVGLGLSLIHQLVELHGGRLFLESTSERGSVFVAEFPPAV